MIRRIDRRCGKLAVVDMRYFVGPESPPSEQGYLQDIERWYIKLYDEQDLSYQGRFLVEQMRFGRGVVAVAPYDTQGFSSPDWSGFQWDAGDQRPRPTRASRAPGRDPVRLRHGRRGLTIPGCPPRSSAASTAPDIARIRDFRRMPAERTVIPCVLWLQVTTTLP